MYKNCLDPWDDYWKYQPEYMARQCLVRLRRARCVNFEWELEKLKLFCTFGKLRYGDLQTSEGELTILVRTHAYRIFLSELKSFVRSRGWYSWEWDRLKVDDATIDQALKKWMHVKDMKRLLDQYRLGELVYLHRFEKKALDRLKVLTFDT